MRHLHLLSAVSVLALAAPAYANANAQSKVYISPTPVPTDLTEAEFLAISDWVEIKQVGSHGETGANTNILTYDTWDTEVIQKAKGIKDAGSPEIEVARLATDPGQQALRAAGATNFNYAFKMERNDPATPGGTPTILFNRGLVTEPRRPHGRNEDFDLEITQLALQQLEIVVDPT